MDKIELNAAIRRSPLFLALSVLFLSGCGSGVRMIASAPSTITISGAVRGAGAPLNGSAIQIYAAGSAVDGSSSKPLLQHTFLTNSEGNFTASFSCPSPQSLIYATAQGGAFAGHQASEHSAISLLVVLGPCGQLAPASTFTMNEVTTVGSLWPLITAFTSLDHVVVPPSAAALEQELAKLSALIDVGKGVTPGPAVPTGYAVQSNKLHALADLLAACVAAEAGTPGDSDSCGDLFSRTANEGAPPSDIAQAAMAMARHQSSNVSRLFAMLTPAAPYLPLSSAPPEDWNLDLMLSPMSPVISPESGVYIPHQTIRLSCILCSSIQYTMDGTTPTEGSPMYTAPLPLLSNFTLKAISVTQGVSSPVVAATFAVTEGRLVFRALPAEVPAGQPIDSPPAVQITDATGALLRGADANVSLALAGTVGTLSGNTHAVSVNGVATFPGVSVHAPASSYNLVATADALPPAESPEFRVMLPRMAMSLPASSIDVGNTMTGTISLSFIAHGPVSISMSSSSSSVRVSSTATIPAGQRSAQFTYTGTAPGTTSLLASASDFLPASAQLASVLPQAPTTLRAAADKRGLLVGAAADSNEFGFPSPLVNEPLYASTLAKQYNLVEPEAAMVWLALRPDMKTYDFGPADALVSFARKNAMKVRGHTLVWYAANPQWLNDYAATATTTQMADLLKAHIQTVLAHYRGKVFAWNVVNEAINDNATASGTAMRDSIWYNQPGIGLSGTGYVEQAFRWAHEADPDALLFYNETNVYTPGPRLSAMLNMLSDFKQRGVPIHGVGLQMHVDTGGWPDTAGLAAAIEQIQQLGLQVHITEMDVNLPVSASGVASAADLQAQAATYERIVLVCLQHPACTAVQTWGFSDKHSWVRAYMPGRGAALPFDLQYQPKPAFDSILKTITDTPQAAPSTILGIPVR